MSYPIAHFCLILVSSIAILQGKSPDQTAHKEVASITKPPEWATLVGSTEGNKYHRFQCNVAQKIRAGNIIWFRDAADATENGYVPAGCKSQNCQPPLPAAIVPLGELGGPDLPPPDLHPPEIPALNKVAATGSASKSSPPDRSNNKSNRSVDTRIPPPRIAPDREAALHQVWQDVPPNQELEARRRWGVWAEWALDRWCERWHVSPSGKINSDAAYSPKMEKAILYKLKVMKEQIDANKSRMKELKAIMEGKKSR